MPATSSSSFWYGDSTAFLCLFMACAILLAVSLVPETAIFLAFVPTKNCARFLPKLARMVGLLMRCLLSSVPFHSRTYCMRGPVTECLTPPPA